jgi:hypothetical protein
MSGPSVCVSYFQNTNSVSTDIALMVFLSLQINISYAAHKSVFINIYNNNVLFWVMTTSSLSRFENVNHVSSITYVPNHAYLSSVSTNGRLWIGNQMSRMYEHTHCVCVLWCSTFGFQTQLRLSNCCCHCSSTVIPSASLGTAVVCK